MDTFIPSELAEYLQFIGVTKHTEPTQPEPKIIRTFEYNMPELDENGEPPF